MPPRLTVVSHASVIDANQLVYTYLQDRFDLAIVVPRVWRDDLRPTRYRPTSSTRLRGPLVKVPTAGVGHPQRHVALVSPRVILGRLRSEFLVIEEEPFSIAASRWSAAARRMGIPYAVQVAENRRRRFPRIVADSCHRVLASASFVLARSPAALARAREWGYLGRETVIPHSVEIDDTASPTGPRGVVGFVGRLVSAKGIDDLVEAVGRHTELRLRVAGDGPLRSSFDELGDRVEVLGTLPPTAMADFYDSIGVLAVPSLTTDTWSEQFGRVMIEAQGRCRPVVAYNSGEIPWVAERTAIVLVEEGDRRELADELALIALVDEQRTQLGAAGRAGVEEHFTNTAVASILREEITQALSQSRGSR